MNIFVLDEDPIAAAKMYCDKHIPKMCVELLQQLGSAAIKHGAQPEQLPVAKSTGQPIRGGYHNHPCTIWCGTTRDNYLWAAHHAAALCEEYTKRFGKEHYCANGIEILYGLAHLIPETYMADDSGGVYQGVGIPIERTGMTPFALAMPDEYKPRGLMRDPVLNWVGVIKSHASGDEAVKAYRRYYHSKAFATWEKGRPMPEWFDVKLQGYLQEVSE